MVRPHVLCNSCTVSRYGACVDYESDGFSIRHVFTELVADAWVAWDVNDSQCLISRRQRHRGHICLHGGMCMECLLVDKLFDRQYVRLSRNSVQPHTVVRIAVFPPSVGPTRRRELPLDCDLLRTTKKTVYVLVQKQHVFEFTRTNSEGRGQQQGCNQESLSRQCSGGR